MLVVNDNLSRMLHAFLCRDQSAKQVARQLWDWYFCVYCFPDRIHMDQDANLESNLILELLQVAGVKTISNYRLPNSNVEWFNRTLGHMI